MGNFRRIACILSQEGRNSSSSTRSCGKTYTRIVIGPFVNSIARRSVDRAEHNLLCGGEVTDSLVGKRVHGGPRIHRDSEINLIAFTLDTASRKHWYHRDVGHCRRSSGIHRRELNPACGRAIFGNTHRRIVALPTETDRFGSCQRRERDGCVRTRTHHNVVNVFHLRNRLHHESQLIDTIAIILVGQAVPDDMRARRGRNRHIFMAFPHIRGGFTRNRVLLEIVRKSQLQLQFVNAVTTERRLEAVPKDIHTWLLRYGHTRMVLPNKRIGHTIHQGIFIEVIGVHCQLKGIDTVAASFSLQRIIVDSARLKLFAAPYKRICVIGTDHFILRSKFIGRVNFHFGGRKLYACRCHIGVNRAFPAWITINTTITIPFHSQALATGD